MKRRSSSPMPRFSSSISTRRLKVRRASRMARTSASRSRPCSLARAVFGREGRQMLVAQEFRQPRQDAVVLGMEADVLHRLEHAFRRAFDRAHADGLAGAEQDAQAFA